MYGANVREEADERLAEELKANRAYHTHVAAKHEEAKTMPRAKADHEACPDPWEHRRTDFGGAPPP